MKIQTGIWIDSKQAIIVFLDDANLRIKKVHSTLEKKLRIPGEGKWFTRMGNQFFTFDKKKEAHKIRDTLVFFKEIKKDLAEVDELVLFGPAEKKNELKKYLLNTGFSQSSIIAVKSADSMTDNQVAAWVKSYFNY